MSPSELDRARTEDAAYALLSAPAAPPPAAEFELRAARVAADEARGRLQDAYAALRRAGGGVR